MFDERKENVQLCIAHHAEACICVGDIAAAMERVVNNDPEELFAIARLGEAYLQAVESKKVAKRYLDKTIEEYGRQMNDHGYNVAMQTYKK